MSGETIEKWKDMLMENKKIVLPIVLAAALLITLGVGSAANRQNEKKEEVQVSAPGETGGEQQGGALTVPDVLLEENAYPEVNELITKYYRALEAKDTSVLPEIMSPMTDDILIHFGEWAKHVQACPAVNIYTKPGPREGSYLAYVVVDVQIAGYDETVPGLNSFFVCKNDAGNYYINIEEEIDKAEADYIKAVNMQDDVVDLNNKVTAEFNQLTAAGSEAAQAFKNVNNSITKGIQEVLLARQAAEAPKEEPVAEVMARPQTIATEVKTTAVVNLRSSDSENADKLGKARVGDKFKVLEQRVNGWSKLTDGTKEFFIKTEFLEVIAEAPAPQAQPAQEAPAQAQPQETAAQEPQEKVTQATANATVNVRKEASATSEKLGKIREGGKVEVIEKQANGWSKIKYNGQTAYVKSEFLE